MNDNLWLALREKVKEREDEKQQKALELADLLNQEPGTIAYDWYQGMNEVGMLQTRYIIVSRVKITEISTFAGVQELPEPEELEGYLKYDVTVINQIERIKTEEKEFKLKPISF